MSSYCVDYNGSGFPQKCKSEKIYKNQKKTLTWFDERVCLIFRLQEFIGRMTRIKDRFWIETNNFIESSNITQNLQTEGIQGTKYTNVKTPQSTVDIPSLSRFEIYPIAQTFCGKPEPL